MEKQGKKITELRVVDLRQILEKRGLEKAGNKSILIERLSKSLADDGLDPNTYQHTFDDGDNGANDSILSETSQSAEAVEVSDSKDTLDEESAEANNAEGKEEVNSAEKCGEGLSLQEDDKMVEVDSLAADQAESTGASQKTPSGEADSGACTTKEEDVLVENTNSDTEHNMQGESTDHAEDGEGDDAFPVDGGIESAEAEDDSTPLDEPPTSEIVADTTTDLEEASEITAAGSDSSQHLSKSTDAPAGSTSDPATGSTMDTDGTFVVHIDESDTNLDYDIKEERDAPTPTKDESMDVDASDIVPSDGSSAPLKQQAETDSKGATSTSSQASKSSNDTRTDTPKKDAKDLAASQNLWISGLSSLTRATDLKAVFSKHGKVIGAKVVTNANRPGAKCYGYVTMSSAEEAAKCIQHLHRTELHSRMISVEKAKSDPAAQARAAAARKPTDADKKKEEAASSTSMEAAAAAKDESSASRSTAASHRSDDKGRHSERHRPRSTGPSSAKKDGEGKEGEKKPEEKKEKTEAERKADEYIEREKRRVRLLERRMRDDDYRRRNALLKEKRELAEQQRRMRMDEERLNREREKLRIDREKMRIEEMKLESLQGERSRLENQLIELRQRVDREREELKRVETLRLEEMRRSTAVKRSYDSSNASRAAGSNRYEDGWESKRPATNDRYAALNVDRRSSSAVGNDRSGYGDRRSAPDMDRRTASVKDVGVDRGSSRSDDRYSTRGGAAGGDRREYAQADRSRDVSSRSVSDSRGVSRSYHDGSSSRRSGGGSGSDRQGGWSGGSSGPPSLLAGPSNELFSGAAVQAAGMMMSAAMSRGSSGATNGTSSRYSSSGAGGGGYAGARRY